MDLTELLSDFTALRNWFLEMKDTAETFMAEGELGTAGTICNQVKSRYQVVRNDKRFTVIQKHDLKEIQNQIKLITRAAFIRNNYNCSSHELAEDRFIFFAYKWFAEEHGMLEKESRNYLSSFPGLGEMLRQLPFDTPQKRVVELMTTYCYQQGGSLTPRELQKHYYIDGERPRHLYIIGNGFDRYHGAESGYQQFRRYLFKKAPQIVSQFDLFFGPRSLTRSFSTPLGWWWCMQPYEYRHDICGLRYPIATWSKSNLWCDFENNLCQLNREKVFDLVDMQLPRVDEGEPGFRYRDYFLPLDQITDMVRLCTIEMKYHLHRWINTLHYAKGFKKRMLSLDKNALFLNFNYTLFLESEYGIPQENILYIHGCRRDRLGSLIIGHHVKEETAFSSWIHKNKNRRRYRDVQKDGKGRYFKNDKLIYLAYFLKDETKGNWRLPIRHRFVNEARARLEDYYNKNYKSTSKIIDSNIGFFDSLSEVSKITVLGHSLSEVDKHYFETIGNSVKSNANWVFSYHTEKDLHNIERFRKDMRIDECNADVIKL